MHKRILLALALLALLLSGVTATAAQVVTDEPFGPVDWCYKFNFITNDHEALVVYGDWESGTGFKSELVGGQHTLLLQIDYPVTVAPVGIVWQIERGFGTGLAPIDVTAHLPAFGITHSPDPLLFQISPDTSPGDTFARIELSPDSADDFGTQASVSLIASNAVSLSSLTVYGEGVNPFPFNHCGPGTATPTATATGSSTPAPTPTQGACLLPGQATPTVTAGPSPTSSAGGVYHNDGVDDETITIGNMGEVSSSPALDGSAFTATYVGNWAGLVYGSLVTVTFPAPVYVNSVGWQTYYSAVPSATLDLTYREAGSGTYVNVVHTGSVSSGWQTHIWDAPVNPPATEVQFYIELYGGGAKTGAIDDITIYYDWVTPATAIPPTAYPECTLTPTITPSVSPTPTHTPTPFTLTPTFTRTPTRTPFPIIVPTTAPTATTGPSSTPVATRTAVPTRTPMPGETMLPDYNEGTVGPFEPPGDSNGGQGTGMTGLGNALIALGSNAWQRATGWVSNAAGTMTRLTDAWAGAVPTALPYMPQCRSNPLANELCAIWYILTFTVFSGTLGSLIIPMGVGVVDIYFLFVFIRLARAIIAQIKQMRS